MVRLAMVMVQRRSAGGGVGADDGNVVGNSAGAGPARHGDGEPGSGLRGAGGAQARPRAGGGLALSGRGAARP